jgi:hypothetical protein
MTKVIHIEPIIIKSCGGCHLSYNHITANIFGKVKAKLFCTHLAVPLEQYKEAGIPALEITDKKGFSFVFIEKTDEIFYACPLEEYVEN